MEFVVERKGYRENDDDDDEEEEEEDEDEEEGEEIGSSISKFPFSSAAAASSSSKAYSNDYSKRQIGDQYCEERSYIHEIEARSGDGVGWMREREREREGDDHREHMFDKVVTPSDVGKLNRLVIPKQHAEKYFPLHSSSSSSSGSEKSGALLDFEDRNGKQWRFRYSYWNSSQSYVMTKGWSRFVKEKKLDAGDIVSFHRCSLISSSSSSTTVAGGGGDDELGGRSYKDKYRLFIDWRHRSPIQQVPVPVPVHVPHPLPYGAWGGYNHNHNHNHNHHHNHHMTQLMNYNQFKPYLFDHHHRHGYCPQQRSVDDLYNSGGANNIHELHMKNMGATAAGSIYYLTPSEEACRRLINMGNHNDHTVINSVPVLHPMNPPPPPPPPPSTSTHSSSPKRLRLFGVNMEEHCCPILQTDHHHHQYQHQHQHVLPSVPYFTMPSSTNINVSQLPNAASTSYLPAAPLSSSSSSTTTTTTTLPKSRNTTSLSFDLHLSDSH